VKGIETLVGGVRDLSSNWQNAYDYHKHLTTLGLGAILFISAFYKTGIINSAPEILIALSILAFLLSMLSSLEVMQILGNMMIYYSGIQSLTTLLGLYNEGQNDHVSEVNDIKAKILELTDKSEGGSKKLDLWVRLTKWSFLSGVIFAACFVLIPTLKKVLMFFGFIR
jgi:hypothetical protein